MSHFKTGAKYTIDGLILRCIKVHSERMVSFQVIDNNGNDVVQKRNGLTVDYGVKLISENLGLVKPFEVVNPIQLEIFK